MRRTHTRIFFLTLCSASLLVFGAAHRSSASADRTDRMSPTKRRCYGLLLGMHRFYQISIAGQTSLDGLRELAEAANRLGVFVDVQEKRDQVKPGGWIDYTAQLRGDVSALRTLLRRTEIQSAKLAGTPTIDEALAHALSVGPAGITLTIELAGPKVILNTIQILKFEIVHSGTENSNTIDGMRIRGTTLQIERLLRVYIQNPNQPLVLTLVQD